MPWRCALPVFAALLAAAPLRAEIFLRWNQAGYAPAQPKVLVALHDSLSRYFTIPADDPFHRFNTPAGVFFDNDTDFMCHTSVPLLLDCHCEERSDEAIQPFRPAQGPEPVAGLDRHGALRAPRDDNSPKATGVWYQEATITAQADLVLLLTLAAPPEAAR